MNKKNNTIIYIVVIFLLIGLGLCTKYYYNFYAEEQKHIKIDEYNFKQLEKVKKILNGKDPKNFNFTNLSEFNKEFTINIKPIKNCYYLSHDNGEEDYIFGFQLESLMYRLLNKGKNYSYPKYNLPIDYICTGGNNCNYDFIFGTFYKTISNPCEN